MKKNTKQNLWIGTEDLTRDPQFMEQAGNEFKDTPLFEMLGEEKAGESLRSNRRDFLKFLGFGLGAATIAAGCDIPVKRAIPYVIKPEEIVPGVATYYASTIVRGGDYVPAIVKTREGRPIKIEGNASSKVTNGGTTARAQAEILNLYNINRLKAPMVKSGDQFTPVEWQEMDEQITGILKNAKGIRLVSGTNMSPTSNKVINQFKSTIRDVELIQYDPVSASALLKANELSFGQRAVPELRFDKARVIVSFNADFLGSWISPVEYAAGYVKNRRIEQLEGARMSRHIQVESHMSLTGSNADNRIMVKPSEQGAAIVKLYNELAKMAGAPTVKNLPLNDKANEALKKVASELLAAKGESLVVCGNNDVAQQLIVNKINDLLGNINKTIDFTHALNMRQGDESGLLKLIGDCEQGKVNAVIFMETNPLYDFSGQEALRKALEKVEHKIAISFSLDETATECNYLAPNHHLLESWGDVNPKRGSQEDAGCGK